MDVKPTGRTDADGNFALSTNETADGAPVGEYAVTVAWFPVPVRRRPDDNDGISPKNVLLAYSDPARTPLKAIVQDGKNEPLTLNVKRR